MNLQEARLFSAWREDVLLVQTALLLLWLFTPENEAKREPQFRLKVNDAL